MSDEKIDGVRLIATPDGNFHIDLPDDDDGERFMSNGEIALLAVFMRVSTDFEWAEELLEWFEAKSRPMIDAANDDEAEPDIEGAAV